MKKLVAAGLSTAMVFGMMGATTSLEAKVTSGKNITETPKYVFYFIGDGMGAEQKQITEYYLQETEGRKLVMSDLEQTALTTTHATDTLVTDSAASGTALATGYKTNSGMISQLPDGTNVETLTEFASEKGMATGIVTTTRLTHATPAVFASHNVSRGNEAEIADDYVTSGVDYFAGGGARFFVGPDYEGVGATGKSIASRRDDDRDLITEFDELGYNTFVGAEGAKAFNEYTPAAGDQVFAVFEDSHMPYTVDGENVYRGNEVPTLADMTQMGIDLLSQNDEGFFMMIEGGRIDHAAHAQDVAGTIYDTIAFDDAIAVAYDFYEENKDETLIVVVGDHETGGLGMGFGNDYFLDFDAVSNTKVSIEDTLQGAYKGDRAAFYTYIGNVYGLTDLSVTERASIERAMDVVDNEESDSRAYGGYNPVAISVAHIVAERSNVQFTTFAHTGTVIPMYAHGVGSHHFSGSLDNTDVAKILFDLLD